MNQIGGVRVTKPSRTCTTAGPSDPPEALFTSNPYLESFVVIRWPEYGYALCSQLNPRVACRHTCPIPVVRASIARLRTIPAAHLPSNKSVPWLRPCGRKTTCAAPPLLGLAYRGFLHPHPQGGG